MAKPDGGLPERFRCWRRWRSPDISGWAAAALRDHTWNEQGRRKYSVQMDARIRPRLFCVRASTQELFRGQRGLYAHEAGRFPRAWGIRRTELWCGL